MPDPIKPATTWQGTQAQSFEALRAEANAQKAKRENLQPMELGKGRYKDIFKVGDRTRPELALTMKRPEPDVPGRSKHGRPLGEATDGAEFGSGELPLDTLIPKQALKDFADAYASANVGAMGEAMEGVRETITYDRDESEQLEWTGHPDRHLLIPQAQEQTSTEAENAAGDLTPAMLKRFYEEGFEQFGHPPTRKLIQKLRDDYSKVENATSESPEESE